MVVAFLDGRPGLRLATIVKLFMDELEASLSTSDSVVRLRVTVRGSSVEGPGNGAGRTSSGTLKVS